MVKGQFVAGDRLALIIFVALSLLGLLLAIIFTIVLNRAEDKADNQRRYASEI